MTEEINNVPKKEEMTQEEIELLHDICVSMESKLRNIGENHEKLFAPALFTMATYVVEKVYSCSPDLDHAALMLSRAQEQGLDNWIAMTEAQRTAAETSPIIVPD